MATGTKNRGFASMDAEKQKEIARKGGRAAHEKGTAHPAAPPRATPPPGNPPAGTEGRPAEHRQTESRPGAHRGEMAHSGGNESMHGMGHRGQHERSGHDQNPDNNGNGREREGVFGSHEQMRDEAEAAVS